MSCENEEIARLKDLLHRAMNLLGAAQPAQITKRCGTGWLWEENAENLIKEYHEITKTTHN